MFNFYYLIDIYAKYHNINKNEVLHLWYRGNITAEDLLGAYLENQGIIGYTDTIIAIVKTLGFQSVRDGNENPWEIREGDAREMQIIPGV